MRKEACQRNRRPALALIDFAILLLLPAAVCIGQTPQEPAKPNTVQAQETELGSHENVWAARLSSDAKYLVSSGSYDGTVTVWDVARKNPVMALDLESFAMRRQFEPDVVQGFAFSTDGRYVAGAYDENVNVWEVAKGRQAHRFSGSTGPVGFTVERGGRVETSGGAAGHSEGVRSVAFSPDGKLLATGSEDNTIKLWDLPKAKLFRTLEGHNAAIWALSFSPDGRSLVSGSNDGTIKIWEMPSGQTIRTLEGHKGGIRALALSADGRWLASGELLGGIRLWAMPAGDEARNLAGHRFGLASIAFSRDGRWLASTGTDGTTRVWDVSSGREVLNFAGGGNSVAFSSDGSRLFASGWSGDKVKIWQVEIANR